MRRWGLYGWGVLSALALAVGMVLLWFSAHDSNVLWKIVHERCARDASHAPCVVYDPQQGYALLKDRRGKGQYLLIPSQRISGVEAELLLHAETPDYFAQAWRERYRVSEAYGRTMPDEMISLAMNSAETRSQNQLHIHIDCIRPDLFAYLRASSASWSGEGELTFSGRVYRRVVLSHLDPSPLYALKDILFPSENAQQRGRHGIFVTFLGKGRFLLLEDKAPSFFEIGGIENLQDHQCRLAQKGATVP